MLHRSSLPAVGPQRVHSETQAELPWLLLVIVSAFKTGIDASGRTVCELEQGGLGTSRGLLLRLNARGP